jgi:hypothetical protein
MTRVDGDPAGRRLNLKALNHAKEAESIFTGEYTPSVRPTAWWHDRLLPVSIKVTSPAAHKFSWGPMAISMCSTDPTSVLTFFLILVF